MADCCRGRLTGTATRYSKKLPACPASASALTPCRRSSGSSAA